jgi:hypothetical protein
LTLGRNKSYDDADLGRRNAELRRETAVRQFALRRTRSRPALKDQHHYPADRQLLLVLL